MPPVFCRNVPNPHPYDSALNDWIARGTIHTCEHHAMARNLQWDHRVSAQREIQFDQYVSLHSPTSQGLQKALKNYFQKEIRSNPSPAFIDSALNGHNIVTGGTDNLDGFAEGRELINVIDLNELGGEYEKAVKANVPGFEDFDPSFDDAHILQWLDERLLGTPDSVQTHFVAQVFQQLSISKQTNAFQPVWIAFWEDFQPYFYQGPNRWCEVLGVPKVRDRVWLVILRYTVADACTLVRPTQLDAGWFPHHFPSPPDRPPNEGGCAMDLEIGNPALVSTRPLAEFIHPQIDFKESFIQAIGHTTRPSAGNGNTLQQRREQHQLRLSRNYAISNWMPNVT